MEFKNFKSFVDETNEIVLLDLKALENIAEAGNSSTTTFQTTRAPGYEYITIPETPRVSRCTIPIAMVCFSVIDMIGQWVNEHHDDDFSHSSSAFFKHLALRDDLKNPETSRVFKATFRHGVIHSFYANGGFGISYPIYDSNSLFSSLNVEKSTLDVRYLLKIVRSGMNKLNQALLNEQSDLAQTAHKGFLRWQEKQIE